MIYENIAKFCAAKEVTVASVEAKADLGRGTIGKWRTSNPTIDNLRKVASVLGVTIDDLIKEEQS